MSEEYVVALDQGTTSTRCMLFNRNGEVIGVSQREHQQFFPQPGWVEHDPFEILERSNEVIGKCLRDSGVASKQIVALGIANQRETTIVWDRHTGRPYHRAIVWQDTRTKAICDALITEGGQDRFRDSVGLPVATYFSGPKIRWLLDQVPKLRCMAQAGDALFGTVDSWLIWWLTGGPADGAHVTDVTNASRTMLMNLETMDWDEDILSALDIPRAMLPAILPSSYLRFGYTCPDGPLGAGIPICGDLGDQQAALIGQSCFRPGEAKNTYGTGCFMLLNTGTTPVSSQSGLLTTVAYRLGSAPPVYCLEGSIAITGALVQWLRDNLHFFERASEVEALARSVEDSGGVYMVPAFSGLFAPYWRSDARGVIVGLSRLINRGHLARAALEATAYQTMDVVNAMVKDSGVKLATLKVDGGMVGNDLLMQFQSDILDVPVVRPQVAETTALGAAYAAGLAVGYWEDLDDLRNNWRAEKEWLPQMDAATRDRLCRGWAKAVERTLNWLD